MLVVYIYTNSLFGDRLGFPLKPGPRPFVVSKELVSPFPNLCMVLVQPLDFDIRQQRRFNEVEIDRSHGGMFKAQPCLVAKVMRSVHFAGHNDI